MGVILDVFKCVPKTKYILPSRLSISSAILIMAETGTPLRAPGGG
jgi:hypothetical protein